MSYTLSSETTSLSIENQLLLLGIDERTYRRLEPTVRESLGKGSLTPLLDIKFNIGENNVLEMPCKLQLLPDNKGSHLLLVYPVNHTLKNTTGLGKVTFNHLKNGGIVVLSNAPFDREYIQLDRETNNFVRIKEKDVNVEEKMAAYEKVRDIQLGAEQKSRIVEGKPVELQIGDEKVTVGLDLKSPNMFRELKGDMESWKRQKEIEYDIAHPEYLGPLHTDENRWEYLIAQKQAKGLQSDNPYENKNTVSINESKSKTAIKI